MSSCELLHADSTHDSLKLVTIPGYDTAKGLEAAAPCVLRLVSRIGNPPAHNQAHQGLRELFKTLMWCLQMTITACPGTAARSCGALLHLQQSPDFTREVASCLFMALMSDVEVKGELSRRLTILTPQAFLKVGPRPNYWSLLLMSLPPDLSRHPLTPPHPVDQSSANTSTLGAASPPGAVMLRHLSAMILMDMEATC